MRCGDVDDNGVNGKSLSNRLVLFGSMHKCFIYLGFRSFVGCYTCIIQYHFYSKHFFFFLFTLRIFLPLILSLFLFESFCLSACKSSFNFYCCFFYLILSHTCTHIHTYISFFHLASSFLSSLAFFFPLPFQSHYVWLSSSSKSICKLYGK